MKVIFAPAARAEFVEAARRYAVEAGQFPATDFRSEVHHTLTLLGDHPAMGTPAASNTRSMVIHRYPYSIVYRIDSDTLRVLAVAHHSRQPGIGSDGDKACSNFCFTSPLTASPHSFDRRIDNKRRRVSSGVNTAKLHPGVSPSARSAAAGTAVIMLIVP